MNKILKILSLLSLIILLGAQEGCQTTTSAKKAVKDNMIMNIKNQIESLGEAPLTKDEAKYKGVLGKDKYIVALEDQLNEIKRKKDEEKAA